VGNAGRGVVAVTTIRNAAGFLDAAGLDADDACQTTGVAHTPFEAPWRGSDREAEKTRLYQYVRFEPQGTPLRKVVRDVFGSEVASADADYQLALRFFERHSEIFKTDRRGGEVWVEPRIGCFTSLNLRQQYAGRKTSGRRGDGLDAAGKTGETVARGDDAGGLDADTDTDTDATAGDDGDPQYAKDRVRSYLDNYLQVNADSVRQSLLSQFVTDKAGTEDRWQLLRRVRGSGDDYLCLPYRTRFNDAGRAGDVRDRFEQALQSASQRHRDAVVLTLTTNPDRHSGLSDALQNLSDNKARLMSWLSTDYQLGHRPENLTVLEFTESGLPHLHVVLFGISYAVSQGQLSAKWRDYGQGTVVDIRTATTPHDGDQWRLHDDGSGTVTLSQYLGKAIRELQAVASADASDLRERIEAGDLSLWKQALYWATERRYMTCSPSLRDTDDAGDGDLPHVTTWEFVGVARYDEIPAHVRQSATFGIG
jgi:hypothetical protein